MKRLISIALTLGGALALAGCYVTERPIVTAANAVWPFAPGAHFKSYSLSEDTHQWEQSGSGVILRNGDHYTLRPDPDEGQQPDPGDDLDFVVADLGGGYYAAQANDDKDHMILMDVFTISGGTVTQYVMMCEDKDEAMAKSHIIARFEKGEFTDTCTVSSLDQLRRAFQAKLAAGMQPHGKYEVVR